MDVGGAETFMMKIYRNIDRKKYQIDFCVGSFARGYYDDEIESLGGKIHRIHSKSSNLKKFKKELYDVVKYNSYDYVFRITSNAAGLMDLKIAKKAGAKVCSARSSNSSDGDSIKQKVAHLVGKLLYLKYVDVAIAPSELAGTYTFGNKKVNSGKVVFLNNALDLNIFKFDASKRKKIREELGISENTLLIGHIGRFETQKNHMFLIDVFKEILNKNKKAKLLLVGQGSLREDIEKQLENLGIYDRVIFTGIRSDVPELLSAIDVLIFPSLYEGMPNTVIEAQATGLPCIISDTITKEADITGLVEYVSLEKTAEEWAEIALSVNIGERRNTHTDFIENGYDIKQVAEKFIATVCP